jgi:hypothetical protein
METPFEYITALLINAEKNIQELQARLYNATKTIDELNIDRLAKFQLGSEVTSKLRLEIDDLTQTNTRLRHERNKSDAELDYQFGIKRNRDYDDEYSNPSKKRKLTSRERKSNTQEARKLVAVSQGRRIASDDPDVQNRVNYYATNYKKKMCVFNQSSSGCRSGNLCIYAHSAKELILPSL